MQKSEYKPQIGAMDSIIDSIVDFVKIRQLNIAEEPALKTTNYRSTFGWVAVILTTAYIIYQYWDVIAKGEIPCQVRSSRSRSRSGARSRSRSRSYYKHLESNSKTRRGRKQHRRCPDCSLCDFEQ